MYYVQELSNLLIMLITLIIIWPLSRAFVPRVQTTGTLVRLKLDEKGRLVVFDILKGVAILAVIIIHCVDLYLKHASITEPYLLNLLNTAMRFTIPLFFIASGALLVPPARTREALVRFYKSKLLRLTIPYVVICTVLGLLYHLPLREFLHGTYTGQLSVPFYFLILLFQLYAIYPFIVRYAKKRWFVYATLYVAVILHFIPLTWAIFDIPLVFRFVFFFVWGIYMREQLTVSGIERRTAPWFGIVGFFWLYFVLFFPGYYYNMQPFYGVAMFVLLYLLFTSKAAHTRIARVLSWLGTTSLWIFLVHYAVMEAWVPWLIGVVEYSHTLTFTLVTATSIPLSIVASYGAMQLYNNTVGPILRRSRSTQSTH